MPCTQAPAFFEFANVTANGLGAACACTAVTGSNGETVTFTRSSLGTCTATPAGGLSVSGIRANDLINCINNKPRTEYDGSGVLGLLVEEARTNQILRNTSMDNAAWSSTATVTADQGASPAGGQTADLLTDNSAGSMQGSSQSVGSATQVLDTVSCYVEAVTASSATIQLVGSGNSAGDCTASINTLSTTTWNRLSCTSAVAYGAGILTKTLNILVGDSASVTGSILVWGCQLEDGAFMTSPIATIAAAVTRVADQATVTLSPSPITTISVALNAGLPTTTNTSADVIFITGSSGVVEMSLLTPTSLRSYFAVANTVDGPISFTKNTNVRFAAFYDGTSRASCINGACATTSGAISFSATPWTTYIGGFSSLSFNSNAIISRVCVDPVSSRCR